MCRKANRKSQYIVYFFKNGGQNQSSISSNLNEKQLQPDVVGISYYNFNVN